MSVKRKSHSDRCVYLEPWQQLIWVSHVRIRHDLSIPAVCSEMAYGWDFIFCGHKITPLLKAHACSPKAHPNVTLKTNDNELHLSSTSVSSANLYIKVTTSQITCQHPEAWHVGFDPYSTLHTLTHSISMTSKKIQKAK